MTNTDTNNLVLWYQKPAQEWTDALPIGNGRLGAMVFGGVTQERIQLNEETLWDGGPRDTNNPKALEALPKVQQSLFDDKNEEATQLAGETMLGVPERIKSYQSLGDLFLAFSHDQEHTAYRRELNLNTGLQRQPIAVEMSILAEKFLRQQPTTSSSSELNLTRQGNSLSMSRLPGNKMLLLKQLPRISLDWTGNVAMMECAFQRIYRRKLRAGKSSRRTTKSLCAAQMP